jgi:hypothetical protein
MCIDLVVSQLSLEILGKVVNPTPPTCGTPVPLRCLEAVRPNPARNPWDPVALHFVSDKDAKVPSVCNL